tara:strand:- start:15973 stop:16218 length:246 start_codon:yes stop_codon:yes gene_type:complete
MNTKSTLATWLLAVVATASGVACGQGGPRPSDLGASKLDLGEPGIAWYTTWETAQAEARRSGRPIMFVAAATQCHGVSGVF